MDATGAGALRDFIQHWRRDGVRIILSGVREQPLDTLRQMGMGTESGVVTFAPSYAEALVMAGGEAPSA